MMQEDDLKKFAEMSGFSAELGSELEGRLVLFASLVAQDRTVKLLEIFSDYIHHEIKVCAQLCDKTPEVAQFLTAHADAFQLDVNKMMSCHLRAHMDKITSSS
jgi:hypothetical protein